MRSARGRHVRAGLVVRVVNGEDGKCCERKGKEGQADGPAPWFETQRVRRRRARAVGRVDDGLWAQLLAPCCSASSAESFSVLNAAERSARSGLGPRRGTKEGEDDEEDALSPHQLAREVLGRLSEAQHPAVQRSGVLGRPRSSARVDDFAAAEGNAGTAASAHCRRRSGGSRTGAHRIDSSDGIHSMSVLRTSPTARCSVCRRLMTSL